MVTNNQKKTNGVRFIIPVLVATVTFFAWTGASAANEEGRRNIVVALTGMAAAVPRNFDGVDYLCFDVDLINPGTKRKIGFGTDCLYLGSDLASTAIASGYA